MTTSTSSAPLVRRALVALGAVLAIIGAAWGSGAFGGTPISEAAGGALAADATLLAPASGAFSIWSVIYAGLVAYAIYQLLPGPGSRPRVAGVAWWVLATLILNAVWIAVVQAGWLWASVLVLAALVATLALIAVRLAATRPATAVEAVVVDGTVGLYLGWATIATVANVTATLRAELTSAQPGDGTPVAIAVLFVAALIAVMLAITLRTSPALAVATALALAWGLGWIAAGRATGEPESLAIMWAAGLAAVVAFAAPFAAFDATRPSPDDPDSP